MFSVATVFLLLASLVAAAGFAVVAQRRLRQLGMLAAVGATGKHLRLVLLTNGAVVGTIAAVIGTIAGLGLWLVFAPTLESLVDHRIDRLSLPWALIAMAGLLAIAGAIAAAWWPGRTVARLPVLLALSGRPPKPRPARHSAIAAVALIAVGIGCLALSDRDTSCSSSPGSWRRSSAACSSGRWRSARSPQWPGMSRSRRDWRCGTWPAIRPGPEPRSPQSHSRSASRRPSSSSLRPRRRNRRVSRPALSDRQIRVYLGPAEETGAHSGQRTCSARPPSRGRSTDRRPTRPGDDDPAPQGH